MRWSKAKTRISGQSRSRLVDQWICSSSASWRSAGVRMPRRRKNCQLLPGRVGRGAAVAADREGAAGVGVFQARRPVLVGEPALEQAGHEAVAGAEHVEDLDREALAALAVVEARGDGAGEGDRAEHRAALADERRAADRAHRAEGGDGVGRAAGDVELLLGADDQVEEVQGGLQLGGDLGALDEALLARLVAGEAPEVGAVVDVERGAPAALAGEAERLQHRRLGARVAEVGAGGDDGAGVGDQRSVDVVLAERHVGAVLAVEDQREALLVADAEDDEGGQPLGVGDHAAGVDAFGGQGLADEAAHVLVADAGDQRRAEAEAGGAGGDVGGRAADVLVEARHVLEPAADLRAVEVDRGPADGDEVERLGHAFPSLAQNLGEADRAALPTDFSAASASARAISPSWPVVGGAVPRAAPRRRPRSRRRRPRCSAS
jgi:hypothetical protein